jgi:uncharacterized membrane protein
MRFPAFIAALAICSALLPVVPVYAQTATTTTDLSDTTTIALPIDNESAGSNDGQNTDIKGIEGVYERAIIQGINLTSSEAGSEVQQHQQYSIELLSGNLKGQQRTISSDLASNPYGLSPKVGDKVVVLIQGSATQGNELIFLEGFDRRAAMFWLLILFVVTLLPYLTQMSGLIYLTAALVLNAGFLYYAIRLMKPPSERFAMEVFNYSIVYLMALFAFLLADHYLAEPSLSAFAR